MASYQKTATGMRVFVYVKGQRDSATFRTLREAKAWAAARETELRDQAGKAPAQRHTLAQALERYRDEEAPKKKGERQERIRIERLLMHRALPVDKPLAEITEADIAAWRDARLRGVAPGTVLRELAVLSSFFEVARREWRWIERNPVRDVSKPKKPKHRERVLTWREIRAMLRAFGYSRRRCENGAQAAAYAMLLALRTGMRAGELCAMTWADVRGEAVKVASKTDAGDRLVPLSPKARAILERLRGRHTSSVLDLDARTLDVYFRRYRRKAGLDGFVFHDTRHTAATWIGRAGRINVMDMCKMFGWTDPKVAMVYYNPSASDIAGRL